MRGLSREQLLEFGGIFLIVILPLAFNPFDSQPSEEVKAAVLKVITIAMVITFLLSSRIQRTKQSESALPVGRILADSTWMKDNPLLIPVLIYSGVYIAATITSIEPQQSFWSTSTAQGTLTVIFLVLFFVLIAGALRSRVQVDRMITVMIVVSVPVSIYGWIQYFGMDPLKWDTTSLSPVHSTVGYSLYLGAFLAMVIPFTLFRIFAGQAEDRNQPFSFILILVLQVACLLFTLSRGAWLGLLGGCMVFFWLIAYRWQKQRLFIFSVVVLIIGGFLFISMNRGSVLPIFSEQSGVSDALIAQTRKAADNDRIKIWINTLPMISSRLWLGSGPETYSISFWDSHPRASFSDVPNFNPWDPHNIFLYHLTATGASGLIAFLWILAWFYWISYRTFIGVPERRTGIMVAAMISSVTVFLIQAQFNPNGIVPVFLFWTLLALGVSASRWAPESTSESRSG